MKNLFIASQFEADFFLDGYKQVDKNIYEKEHRVIITGIGLVNTAISCTHFFNNYSISEGDEYINLGIAGAVDANLNIGEIVEPGSFSVFNKADVTEASKKIIGEAYPEIQKGGLKIASSPVPVWDEESLSMLQAGGVSIVDMEAYAFARVCEDFKLSFKVIKSVSDHLSKKSQEEFLENARQSLLNIKQVLY